MKMEKFKTYTKASFQNAWQLECLYWRYRLFYLLFIGLVPIGITALIVWAVLMAAGVDMDAQIQSGQFPLFFLFLLGFIALMIVLMFGGGYVFLKVVAILNLASPEEIKAMQHESSFPVHWMNPDKVAKLEPRVGEELSGTDIGFHFLWIVLITGFMGMVIGKFF